MFWKLKNNDIIDITMISFYDTMTTNIEITTPYYFANEAIYKTEDNLFIQKCKSLSELPKSENLFEILPEGSIIITKNTLRKTNVWSEKSGICNSYKTTKLVNEHNYKKSIKMMDELYKKGEIEEIYIPFTYAGRKAYIKFK